MSSGISVRASDAISTWLLCHQVGALEITTSIWSLGFMSRASSIQERKILVASRSATEVLVGTRSRSCPMSGRAELCRIFTCGINNYGIICGCEIINSVTQPPGFSDGSYARSICIFPIGCPLGGCGTDGSVSRMMTLLPCC